MSNDLISRIEVMKTLESAFDKYNMTWDKQGGFAKEVPDSIRNIPTAYDVDKVLKQLEEKTEFLSDCKKYGNQTAEQQEKSYATMMMYEIGDLIDDLIEIVKAGGANE